MRIVLLVAFGVLAGSCGSTRALCTSATCASGCCDRAGECHLGSLETACGSNGGTCVVCSGGEKCSGGRCATGGSGGGSGGGAAGGAGGGSGLGGAGGGASNDTYPTDGGCWQLPTFEEDEQVGGWSVGRWMYEVRGSGQNVSAFGVDSQSGAVPGTQMLHNPPLQTQFYGYFAEGCSRAPAGKLPLAQNCAHEYIAVSGTMTVNSVSGTMQDGGWTGSVMNVHFRERFTDAGSPYAIGTRCVDLGFEAMNVRWTY